MSWLKIDDGFPQHPKVIRLKPLDRWTWLEVLCYCARFRSEGKVPVELSEVVKRADRAFLERAEKVGLLDRAKDGYVVHDWAIYNSGSIEERVASYLRDHPDASANEVQAAVPGQRKAILAAIRELRDGGS